ncbi:MAG: NADH-quinone oxidoreductase subunit NuoK [Candidatus Margulisiibacteriota bacterium]
MTVLSAIPCNWYVALSLILFFFGLCGLALRRNTICMLMSVELMFNAVNLLLVTFSAYFGDLSAQIFVFFIMIVAAAEVSVGLAIITLVYRTTHTVDSEGLQQLKW